MRITVLILGLLLGLLMFLQTLLVYGTSNLADDQSSAEAGAVGILMALLWLVACAFVIPKPRVSVVLFIVAGGLGFLMASEFGDLAIWGVVSLVLALLSWFGLKGKLAEDRERMAERARQDERDRMLEDVLRRQA